MEGLDAIAGESPGRRRQRRHASRQRQLPLGSLALLLLHERVEIVRVHHANLDGGFVNVGSLVIVSAVALVFGGGIVERGGLVRAPSANSSTCSSSVAVFKLRRTLGAATGVSGRRARAHALKRPGRGGRETAHDARCERGSRSPLLAGGVVVVAWSDGDADGAEGGAIGNGLGFVRLVLDPIHDFGDVAGGALRAMGRG